MVVTGDVLGQFSFLFFNSVLNIHAQPRLSISGLLDMPDMGILFILFFVSERTVRKKRY